MSIQSVFTRMTVGVLVKDRSPRQTEKSATQRVGTRGKVNIAIGNAVIFAISQPRATV